MSTSRKRSGFVALLAACTLGLSLLAAGAQAGPPKYPLKLMGWAKPANQKYSVAYFCVTPINTYVQAGLSGVQQAAQQPQVKLTVFTDNWSGTEQLSQIENAISSKKFNAFVACLPDPHVVCRALSKEAPAAGI